MNLGVRAMFKAGRVVSTCITPEQSVIAQRFMDRAVDLCLSLPDTCKDDANNAFDFGIKGFRELSEEMLQVERNSDKKLNQVAMFRRPPIDPDKEKLANRIAIDAGLIKGYPEL